MSRNKTEPEVSGFNEVCGVLCRIRDADQMRRFLEEILTPAECRDLALRWKLMQRLLEGTPQRKIASELGISLCKITRGAKVLKDGRSLSKRYLESRRKK
jgi:TrpR family trp operon transcriptional repressor